MAPMKLVHRLAEVLCVGGFIALIALRITPLSWFPWDLVVTALLLVAGIGLALIRKRLWPNYQADGKSNAV